MVWEVKEKLTVQFGFVTNVWGSYGVFSSVWLEFSGAFLDNVCTNIPLMII